MIIEYNFYTKKVFYYINRDGEKHLIGSRGIEQGELGPETSYYRDKEIIEDIISRLKDD